MTTRTAAAGVNPQFVAEVGLIADFFHRVHGGLGGVYLEVTLLAGEKLGDLGGDEIGTVLAACCRIDDKQMLHKFTSQIEILFLLVKALLLRIYCHLERSDVVAVNAYGLSCRREATERLIKTRNLSVTAAPCHLPLKGEA